jgi:hypothetical protein
MKYFNIAGPCYKAEHYMIEASSRLHGAESLIDMKQYFVIHAARQSGKTTYMNIYDITENNRKAWNEALKYHQKARGEYLTNGFLSIGTMQQKIRILNKI